MKNAIKILFAVFLLVTFGTAFAGPTSGDNSGTTTIKITNDVSAVMKHIVKSPTPPKTANKDVIGAEIDFRFPEFSSSVASNPAVAAINKAIQSRLLTLLEDKTPTTVEQLMESFFKGYEQSLKDEPEMPGGWSLKFEANIKHSDEDLLCLEIFDSIFTGGAHPSSNIAYLVFSIKTGEQIPLSEFIPDNQMPELTKIAEKYFRQVRNLKPQETYEQVGFQFDQNRFTLNRNFLVSKDGLAFCFNQYEIGAYALGLTELVLPWADLKTIANSNGLCGRFLK
ncbi:MAG: DUF3298 domain-containing protein [Candidatus Riflebacteria bacterium]|nr:DUF3298 domain-containing protein [Candidatus Riflebacteria bacterium]